MTPTAAAPVCLGSKRRPIATGPAKSVLFGLVQTALVEPGLAFVGKLSELMMLQQITKQLEVFTR